MRRPEDGKEPAADRAGTPKGRDGHKDARREAGALRRGHPVRGAEAGALGAALTWQEVPVTPAGQAQL